MFFKGSRYEGVGTATLVDARGREVRYKKLRVIGEVTPDSSHVVGQGERIDHVASERLGDPERFWRICDANRAAWPADLVAEPGLRIVIPTPDEGR